MGYVSTSRGQAGYQVWPGSVPVAQSGRHVKAALALVRPQDDLYWEAHVVRSPDDHRVTGGSVITNRQDQRGRKSLYLMSREAMIFLTAKAVQGMKLFSSSTFCINLPRLVWVKPSTSLAGLTALQTSISLI